MKLVLFLLQINEHLKIQTKWSLSDKRKRKIEVRLAHPSVQYHWSCQFLCISIFRYLYGDLYAGAIWAGVENPENSGNFSTSKIPFGCAHDSPIQCKSVPQSTLPALGYIYSFGEDNSKDILILASSGVYRVVRPSRCNYTCSKENFTAIAGPGPAASPGSSASRLSDPCKNLVLLVTSLLLFLLPFV